jgi:hypothetical protein
MEPKNGSTEALHCPKWRQEPEKGKSRRPVLPEMAAENEKG